MAWTEKEIREYAAWMYDIRNMCACNVCPENLRFKPGPDGKFKCGQYRCIVGSHCKPYVWEVTLINRLRKKTGTKKGESLRMSKEEYKAEREKEYNRIFLES